MEGASRLTVTTPSDQELCLTRRFDAPRDLVFEAWTTPALLRRWFGPRGSSLVVCEIDLRVGGTWRYVLRSEDGREMGLGGVYREIVAPERIVATERFDGVAGEHLATTRFVEDGGGTTLSMTVRYGTKAGRDSILASNMERGVGQAFDKLDELLAVNRA